MIERKAFIKSITLGPIGAFAATTGSVTVGSERKDSEIGKGLEDKPRMVVGCQSRVGTSKENLEFLARHGVYHMDPGSPSKTGLDTSVYNQEANISTEDNDWDLTIALRQVEEADKYGISIDAFHLSGGGSHFEMWKNIMLGKSPERDREIEQIHQKIEIASKASVQMLMYNATLLPVIRTGVTVDPDRGNVSYNTWNYREAVERGMHEEPHEAGIVDSDEMYDRITYWLDRVIPVAEEFNVKMACHIADPPVPAGYRGITRWNSPDIFEGIKRFGQLYDSPSHGFNFCIGSTAEGLKDPGNEIFPVIKWMGERNQIFNVHFRNIKGGLNNFQEVYPDNGDMNFVKVLQALKDAGYAGMVMPDHIPAHDDPASRDQGFAYVYGYTKALLQSLYGYDAYPDHALNLTAAGYSQI